MLLLRLRRRGDGEEEEEEEDEEAGENVEEEARERKGERKREERVCVCYVVFLRTGRGRRGGVSVGRFGHLCPSSSVLGRWPLSLPPSSSAAFRLPPPRPPPPPDNFETSPVPCPRPATSERSEAKRAGGTIKRPDPTPSSIQSNSTRLDSAPPSFPPSLSPL